MSSRVERVNTFARESGRAPEEIIAELVHVALHDASGENARGTPGEGGDHAEVHEELVLEADSFPEVPDTNCLSGSRDHDEIFYGKERR